MDELSILVTVEKYTLNRTLASDRREFTVSIMKTAGARGWARKTFNKWLAAAGPDEIVTVRYSANQKAAEGTLTLGSGLLSGVNGRQLREDGVFEP